MKFDHRNYSSNNSKVPIPFIRWDASNQCLIVATAWGKKSLAERICDDISDSISSINEKSDLSISQQLKEIIVEINSNIINEFNNEEIVTGLEISILLKNKNQIYIVNYGAPSIFWKKPNKESELLTKYNQLNLEFSMISPPLPKYLIGIKNNIEISSECFQVEEEDQFLLITRQHIPNSLIQEINKLDLDLITKACSNDNHQYGYWCGILEI